MGYGWHGDYVFGWQGDALQKALDAKCTGDACTVLKTQTAEKANACMINQQVVEPVEGCKWHSSYHYCVKLMSYLQGLLHFPVTCLLPTNKDLIERKLDLLRT